MLRPKINDVYMAYSKKKSGFFWRMQVVALLEFNGEKSIVCLKWLKDKPAGGQFYLFNMQGYEVNSDYMRFWLGAKSRAKSRIKAIGP